MRNTRGLITVDYLFSFCLVAGFAMVIITFSTTLSMVEVVQYIAFATARNYFAANVDEPHQEAMAGAKLNALLSNNLIRPLVSGGWFTVDASKVTISSDFTSIYPPSPTDPNRYMFEGVLIPFSSNVLAMQIPFFGSTVKSDQSKTSGGAFQTNITAFLGREPTFNECNSFNSQRWTQIQALSSSYNNKSGSVSTSYVVINDNGC